MMVGRESAGRGGRRGRKAAGEMVLGEKREVLMSGEKWAKDAWRSFQGTGEHGAGIDGT